MSRYTSLTEGTKQALVKPVNDFNNVINISQSFQTQNEMFITSYINITADLEEHYTTQDSNVLIISVSAVKH